MTKVAIIFLVILYFLSELPSKTKQKSFFCVFSVLGLILVSGLRSIELGYDTENYLNSFHESSNISMGEIIKSFWGNYFTADYLSRDPGFAVFEKIISLFTSSDQIYLLLVASLCIIPIGMLIFNKTRDKKDAFLAFMYYVFFYFNYIPNSAIRQSISLGILLLAYKFIEKERNLYALLFVLLASTIHKSSLVFLLLLLLHSLKLHKFLFKYALVLYGVFLFFYQALTPYIVLLFGDVYSNYVSSDFFSGTERSYTFIIFLTLIYLMTLIPVIIGKEKNFENNKIMYLSSAMALSLTPFMLITPTILRITVYFAVYNFVLIPHSVRLYKTTLAKLIYISLILLFLITTILSSSNYSFYWQ